MMSTGEGGLAPRLPMRSCSRDTESEGMGVDVEGDVEDDACRCEGSWWYDMMPVLKW